MAKNDNLKDFLTDVADAIREKKGTTDLINPQDFSAEIASIKSGGGAVAVSAKAVNFRDYDGTILHSYTKEEFLALTELPPLPTREGLICQEWNWDYADAVEYVTEYGVLEVGATYITDDGKTRLYITIEGEGRSLVPLYFNQSGSNGVIIDWGDGSTTETINSMGAVSATHQYSGIGNYVITLDVKEGVTAVLGYNSSSYSVMGATENAGLAYCNMLQKVEIGKNMSLSNSYIFNKCYSLRSISLPKQITSFALGTYIFASCRTLRYVAIPNGVGLLSIGAFSSCTALVAVSLPLSLTSIRGSAFYSNYSLSTLCVPKNVESIGDGVCSYCYSLRNLILPSGLISIDTNSFNYCYSLAYVVMPNSITSIGSSLFYYCDSLVSVVMSNSISSIPTYTFRYCFGLAKVDFSNSTFVPSLAATNAFSNNSADRRIVVPDALYDEWISSTNWSVIAAAIIKKSEWDALNA